MPVEYKQVVGIPAQLAQQVLSPLKAVQRPGILARFGHLVQGLLYPAQFSRFIVQYRDTHVRWFLGHPLSLRR
ncbi:hypothetical protein D3C76_1038290 [compost metagenome]